MSKSPANLAEQKASLRNIAYAARRTQVEKDRLSEIICQNILALAEYQQAHTIMCYLHCRSELRTSVLLNDLLEGPKRIVIPYCTLDDQRQRLLGLWELRKLDELVAGMWGILEPPQQRWQDSDRLVTPAELDLLIVPGVAFDRNGGRLGNGKGYYDRLLAKLQPSTLTIGAGYESQVFDVVPQQATDQALAMLATEQGVYRFR